MITLDKVKKGDAIKIISIPDDQVRAQAIRFGIAENEIVKIVQVVPAGPIVLEKGKQEIAIGRNLAQKITIEIINSGKNLFRKAI